MKLYIKNMVSKRCKKIVQSLLEEMGFTVVKVELGNAEIKESISDNQRVIIDKALKEASLELMENQKTSIVESIKDAIDGMVYNMDELSQKKYSDYISEKICLNYTYLSNIFSDINGYTIESYIIKKKIDRAKELLTESELNLTQISYILNYSSVAHLSNQFKKVTGMTPSRYKKRRRAKVDKADSVDTVTVGK